MKRLFSAMLCIAMLVVVSGCSSTPNFKKVYDQLNADGFKFDYSYVEMEEAKGNFYTLKVMPKDFSLKDSSYFYFNVSDYADEALTDNIIATIYHAHDGEIYGVNANVEQQTMINGTCFVDYESLEPIKSTVGKCNGEQIEKMKEHKETIQKFLDQYGLAYDDLSAFYEWYASEHADSVVKE